MGFQLLLVLLGALIGVMLTLAWLRLRHRRQPPRHDVLDSESGYTSSLPDGDQGRLAKAFRKVVAQVKQQGQAGSSESRHLLEQLQATLDLAPVGIVFTRKHRFELVSQHFAQMLGRDAQSLRGQHTIISYATPQDFDDLVERARAVFADASGSFDGHARMARLDGSVFWGRLRGRAVVPGHMEAGTLWIIEDVTQEREKQESLSWLAGHDPLTGLCNRGLFESQLQRAHEQALKQPFCALFIDLDYFKRVNDSGGHAAGDRLLTELAMLLMSHVRQNDLVARLGGDEFAVLLAQCPLERALQIAEAIRREIEGFRLQWEGLSLGVGASIGVISHGGQYESAAGLLRAADAACYAAKGGGRNRVVVGGLPGTEGQASTSNTR